MREFFVYTGWALGAIFGVVYIVVLVIVIYGFKADVQFETMLLLSILNIDADAYSNFYVKYRDLNPANYEYFADITAVTTKYPELTTKLPTSIAYYGRIVNVNGTLKQALYNVVNNLLYWGTIPASKTNYASGVLVDFQKAQPMSGWVGPSVKLITGDMLTVNLAFPIADNIMSTGITEYISGVAQYGFRSLPSADRVESMRIGSTDISSYIINKRIVTGLAFNEQGTHRPSGCLQHLSIQITQT